ncbi:MAG: class F sortase [Thermomicrobiales bacterium]
MSESRELPHSRFRPRPLSGLARIVTAFSLLAIIVAMGATVAAQDIVSTRVGEMPTTGGLRPGPVGLAPEEPSRREGVEPVAIAIERAQVDAVIEIIEIVDGVMQNPTGPWVVSWYKETAKLGELGNAVMAGHLDYWDVGPAVFYNIGLLEQGDQITVTGENGEQYVYEVDWLENYDVANAPIQDIVGPTEDESLTLITCGGPFDYQTGEYLQRTVVRAHRVIG